MIKNLENQLRAAHRSAIESAAENGRLKAELEDCEERCAELRREVERGHDVRTGLRAELEAMTQKVIELSAMLRHPSQVGGTPPVDPADQEL